LLLIYSRRSLQLIETAMDAIKARSECQADTRRGATRALSMMVVALTFSLLRNRLGVVLGRNFW
jgi:hypothetical protein